MKQTAYISCILTLALSGALMWACSDHDNSWIVESVSIDESEDSSNSGSSIGQNNYVFDVHGNQIKDSFYSQFSVVELRDSLAEYDSSTTPITHSVKILSPINNQVIQTKNSVDVAWTIDGVEQELLTKQRLEKGPNLIVRCFYDKFGNSACDTVHVFGKASQNIELSHDTIINVSKKDVLNYYKNNPPKKGETFVVSIQNFSTNNEEEILIGGQLDSKDKNYKGVLNPVHLGPTFTLNIAHPVVISTGGLATLDDILLSDDKISSVGMKIDTSKLSSIAKTDYKEYSITEYINQFCESGTPITNNPAQFNLYSTTVDIDVTIYLPSSSEHFSFKLDMNKPDFVDEAGNAVLSIELKPDAEGSIKPVAKNFTSLFYTYKINVSTKSKLRCNLPPLNSNNIAKRGDKKESSAEFSGFFFYNTKN